MAVPTFVDKGVMVASIGAISPTWHFSSQPDDIGILLVESTSGEAVTFTDAAGFVAVEGMPVFVGTGTAGTRLSAYWKRAIASETDIPAPQIADSGNHTIGVILTFRGCKTTGNPWDAIRHATKGLASTTVVTLSLTTVTADSLVLLACTRDNDASGAAFTLSSTTNLTSAAEIFDDGSNVGNGGGIAAFTGIRATAGTCNFNLGVTSSVNAYMQLALVGQDGAPPELVDAARFFFGR